MSENRNVSALSPGRLTARRFFRNRLAVVGLIILGAMFLFSFVGGWLIPYGQDQVFYREELQLKEVAGIRENREYRFLSPPGRTFDSVLQAMFTLTAGKEPGFTWENTHYAILPLGESLYAVTADGEEVALAYRDIPELTEQRDYPWIRALLIAYANGQEAFTFDDIPYRLDSGDIYSGAQWLGRIGRLVFRSNGGSFSPELQTLLTAAAAEGEHRLSFDGRDFYLAYDAAAGQWSVREGITTRVWDAYAFPSLQHPLGTDKNGMDMLTRLMYGGRVSLTIGFIVVGISGTLGVLFGSVSGYFGGWADNLIMRLVDIFYCIPSTPLLIILGAAMDGMRVEPQLRMLLLMLILGILGWPGIARMVRGQILSLREQDFMVATEAVGLSVGRRIFLHLLPNVIPQLIVSCTMRLGSTILTEATLSFLGLGVKFPFASWGNIINDVSNSHVLTSYWFVWIPAGICLILAVLGFNFVGDGLRDAFDPKMKR